MLAFLFLKSMHLPLMRLKNNFLGENFIIDKNTNPYYYKNTISYYKGAKYEFKKVFL